MSPSWHGAVKAKVPWEDSRMLFGAHGSDKGKYHTGYSGASEDERGDEVAR